MSMYDQPGTLETDHVEDGMRHEVARQLALMASVGARDSREAALQYLRAVAPPGWA